MPNWSAKGMSWDGALLGLDKVGIDLFSLRTLSTLRRFIFRLVFSSCDEPCNVWLLTKPGPHAEKFVLLVHIQCTYSHSPIAFRGDSGLYSVG